MKKTLALALIAVGLGVSPALATQPHTYGHPFGKVATSASSATPNNVVSIGTALLNDFIAAQTEAGPASAPVDPTGFACYTVVVNNLNGFAKQSPDGIVSTGEAMWLLAQTAQTVAANQSCQSVCGRVQMLAGKVGGLLGALTVPNVCGAFTSLAE
jgi:hypothetical protein